MIYQHPTKQPEGALWDAMLCQWRTLTESRRRRLGEA